jgi:protein TonB
MRWAVPTSVAVHLGLIAGAWLFLQLKPEDSTSAEAAVSVAIIEMQDAVTEPSETVSEETANLVSAGMTQAAAEPEPIEEVAEAEPVETAQVQPAQPVVAAAAVPVTETIEPAETEALVSAEVMTALATVDVPVAAPIPQVTSDTAPVVADTVAPSDAKVLEHLDQAAKLAELTPTPEVQQLTTASISPLTPARPVESTEPVKIANLDPVAEPIVEEPVETPPVPAPRITRKPVEAETKPVEDKAPVEKKKAEKPVEKKQVKQVASLGNSGENEADSAAAKASGGKQGKVATAGGNDAAYVGKVRAKVLRSLKAPSGRFTAGEVRVAFTIDASGRLVNSWLSRSSGDDKVDKAALAAVKRAAPFPSFSEGASRSFTFPLMIQ